MSHLRHRDDSGVTLIEVLTTCLLLSILLGLAVGPWNSWRDSVGHRDATRELVAVLRSAQISAVSENQIYRVDVTSTSVTSYRVLGSVSTPKGGYTITDSKVTYTDAVFIASDGTSGTSVYFYPRGSASGGSLVVRRTGRSKIYTVDVEGLTARVSYEG